MSASQHTLTVDNFIDKFPSPIISYDEAESLAGGFIAKKTLQNLCYQGLGPAKIRLGKRVGFRTVDFCEWLCGQLQAI